MREKISHLFGLYDRFSVFFAVIAFLLSLSNIAVVSVFVIPRFGDMGFLRLHYTVALGIDWVDDWRYIFVFPFLAVAVFLANGFLSGLLARRHRRLGVMLLGVTMLIEAFIMIGTAMAVSLNG